MKASTLFLGFTLVVLAAVLAGLWQAFGPRPGPQPRPAAAQVAAVSKRPPPPVVQPEPSPPDEGVRSVYGSARPSAARAPQPETSPAAVIIPPPPAPAPAATPVPPPAPERTTALTPPGIPPASGPEAAATGEGVDLNTASVEALNNLGAGKIAKTIIANRPFTAPDDLVTRRVLKRKDYEVIKARVVVR